MKKTIIVLLLTIPIITFGQNLGILPFKNKTTEWDDVTKLANEIIEIPKQKYKIESIDTSSLYLSYKSLYVGKIYINMISSDNNNNMISLQYDQSAEGTNKDLEIAGIKTFNFEEISGTRYLDMFELWKTFFDPKADVQEVSGMGRAEVYLDDKVVKRAVFWKRPGNIWVIGYGL